MLVAFLCRSEVLCPVPLRIGHWGRRVNLARRFWWGRVQLNLNAWGITEAGGSWKICHALASATAQTHSIGDVLVSSKSWCFWLIQWQRSVAFGI